ncbi:MAG: hypothetical protein A3F40_01885 [Chlamydiae bacterium RIFCSPHIGHO2_12_FULL_27_8]|nr:MAG: hypothetical protein A3F40_01885 [Chlamydiae bacterium RIFCSPHIGHO2_12_FULL_27_8]OGN65566.1 MAG: hypothetical protein A2888_02525 [Chlamydiae bacterium RIFCSPLOWO2_01_FULL_28_7]
MGFLEKVYSEVILKSWWVVLFLLISYIGFDQGIKKRNKDIQNLNLKLSCLVNEKNIISKRKEELFFKINSQSDPAWIELVLMKELGVVPEGQIKIHFKN